MVRMYQKFGDFIFFDITYNLIKQKTNDNRQYGVGVFSGLDNNLRIVVFAVALISRETTESIIKLFQGFFKIYSKHP